MSEKRKCETLSAPSERARRELDFHVLTGDHGFVLVGDLAGELLTQALDELWNLDAQEAVVVGIAQVGLRETRGDDQRDAFCFQAGNSLFPTGTCAEVETPDNDVSRAGT